MKNRQKVNIAILGHYFLGWNGGVDFLSRFIVSLGAVSKEYPINLFLIFPDKKKCGFFGRKILELKICLKKIIGKNCAKYQNRLCEKQITKDDLIVKFSALYKEDKILFINYRKNFARKIAKFNIDITLFAEENLSEATPNIAYYPDLQHRHLVDFFTAPEIEGRDKQIMHLLCNSKAVLVNAVDVKKDIENFFADDIKNTKLYSLPFAPIMLDKHWLDDLAYDVVKKYNLPQKYFVISNQFWIHKDHRTAFKALKLLHKNNKNLSDIAIVCTGATHDYRFPKYFCELEAEIKKMGLEEKIFFLGLVDRRDQIEIIKKSIAMIQPTLFEGGPGGGAVYDAISLGVPTIISDIAVNCEIGDIAQNNFYFKTKDAKNLSEKMLFVVNSHLIRPSNEQLIINNEKNIHNYGSEIVKIIFSNLNN